MSLTYQRLCGLRTLQKSVFQLVQAAFHTDDGDKAGDKMQMLRTISVDYEPPNQANIRNFLTKVTVNIGCSTHLLQNGYMHQNWCRSTDTLLKISIKPNYIGINVRILIGQYEHTIRPHTPHTATMSD